MYPFAVTCAYVGRGGFVEVYFERRSVALRGVVQQRGCWLTCEVSDNRVSDELEYGTPGLSTSGGYRPDPLQPRLT